MNLPNKTFILTSLSCLVIIVFVFFFIKNINEINYAKNNKIINMPVVNNEISTPEVSRDKIEEKYKWNLQDLFASSDVWKEKKSELETKIGNFEKYKGKLADSANTLFDCLELSSVIGKEYSALAGYAYQLSDQDTRETEPVSMKQEIEQLGIKLSSATSFIEPEILSIDPAIIQKFFKINPALKNYAHYIDNVQRLKPHTRNADEEQIISQAGLISSVPSDIYSIFKDADMPRPTIKLEDGQSVRLDDSAYTLYRSNPDRELRKNVFEEFFGNYKKFERTFGTELYSQIKSDIFFKNVRNYDSSLERALNGNNIPVAVYKNLIDNVHQNLSSLDRYFHLRKRMLGLDQLYYYDIYTPLVKNIDTDYSLAEAQDLVKKALTPLGADYEAMLDKAFSDRWIDYYPNTGKTPGGYSSGSFYEAHPYILMNYNGKYDDVSTLAHELGHTMHSYYSNKNQSFVNANYPIFLAEVASTTNEALLINQILQDTTDPEKRLAILGNKLETFRGTLFRQTQFAEFELKIHELAEQGKSLTGEELSKLYLDILRNYYGADRGTMVIDDLYGIEWAFVPHFYYNFYVFQYSTSLCASTAISEKIINNEGDIREKYIKEFLSAGGSDYAIPTLKRLGIDMTTAEPCQLAFEKMNKIMDEMEQILDNKEK